MAYSSKTLQRSARETSLQVFDARGIVKAPPSQLAALPVLTQLVTSRLHAAHKAHKDKRARPSFASNRRSSTFVRFNIFCFQVLPFYGLCPPSRGALARFSTGSRTKKNARHIRYKCVFVCARLCNIGPRRRLYQCWLPRRGCFPQLLWLPVCVCVCVFSASRGLAVFANHCAGSGRLRLSMGAQRKHLSVLVYAAYAPHAYAEQ